MRFALALVCFVAAAGMATAEERDGTPESVLLELGPVTLKPSGFLETIGMSRSATTVDSVSTKFGNIPLADEPGQDIGSVRHSRLMLHGDVPAGPVKFSAYLESDFMNFTSGESPWRWRQYWAQATIGKWEILGGQAWSLLRPNREGTATDTGMMNTDVVDPAYHVGLAGSRVRQLRVTRTLGVYKAVVAWEGAGIGLAKLVRETQRQHYELGAFTGRFERRGATAAAAVGVAPRVRLVTQQFWSKRAAYQALGVAPAGVNGVSSLEGVEAQVKKNVEVYAYGGLVYAARAAASANRLVQEWTTGFNQRIGMPSLRSGVILSLQYSHIGRAVWDGRSGTMDYLMCRMRYTFN
jgi:hypothetical protein